MLRRVAIRNHRAPEAHTEAVNEQERHADELLGRDYADAWDELKDVSGEFTTVPRREDRQIDVRVDDKLLASLRATAALLGTSYHSLARQYVKQGVVRSRAARQKPSR